MLIDFDLYEIYIKRKVMVLNFLNDIIFVVGVKYLNDGWWKLLERMFFFMRVELNQYVVNFGK